MHLKRKKEKRRWQMERWPYMGIIKGDGSGPRLPVQKEGKRVSVTEKMSP